MKSSRVQYLLFTFKDSYRVEQVWQRKKNKISAGKKIVAERLPKGEGKIGLGGTRKKGKFNAFQI